MTVKDYLLQLKQAGHLTRLVRLGYLSPKASVSLEMWLCYDALTRTTDKSPGQAVRDVATEFNSSRSTVYRRLAALDESMPPMKEK